MRKLLILIGIIALTSVTKQAYAMRCNGKLVLVGDSIIKVIENCGRPLYSQRIIHRDRFMTLLIYKKKYGREKRLFILNATVVEVVE